MKPSRIIAVLFLLLLVSCSQKQAVDRKEVVKSFTEIYGSFKSSGDIQKQFLDKLTDDMRTLKYDNTARIDTARLIAMLEAADAANNSQRFIITATKETDRQIGLKGKALSYVSLLDSAINNELPQIISIIASTGEKRFEKITELMAPRIERWQAAEMRVEDALQQTMKKYDIVLPAYEKSSQDQN